ncbi:MAG: HEAT repeat domain-containing protein [Desulfobacteraceae bacterium]
MVDREKRISEILSLFVLAFRQSHGVCPERILRNIILNLLVLVVSIALISCKAKPTLNEIENIQTVHLRVEQTYSNVEEDIVLPIEEMLSDLLSGREVEVVAEDESCDATLTISLKGKPRKATFTKPRKMTFYEAAVVNGVARLSMEGYASKKVDLSGSKHYYSTTYYPHSNTDPRKPLIYAAKNALVKMLIELWGPSILLVVWQDRSYYGVNKAIDEIVDEPANIVPVILQALKRDNVYTRRSAIHALDEFTRTHKYNVPGKREYKIVKMSLDVRQAVLRDLGSVVEAIKDEDERVSGTAMRILERFGQEAKQAIPALHEALKSDNKDVRARALRTLGTIAEPKESVRLLIKALQSDSNDVRRSALIALGHLGAEAEEALPQIIKILDDEGENPNIRDNAARALKKFGPHGRDAVPALIRALKTDAPFLPHSAAKSLQAITGQDFGRAAEKWQQWWETQGRGRG